MLFNLPNLLTLSRIVALPLFVGAFYLEGPLSHWVSFGIFALAAITDFFDGYFARALQQQSNFGRFLDPVADKLLVAAAIVMLVAFERVHGLTVLPALVILCREILVSGLREFLAEVQISVPVSRLAKWKTTIQMLAIGFLLLGNVLPAIPLGNIGVFAIWAAAVLTLITGYDYFRHGLQHLLEAPASPPGVGKPHRNIFGITGSSGSGKTTLMTKLVPELNSRGLSVSTMKLSHHDIDVDQAGKDSHAHRSAGAREVLLAAKNRWALFHEYGPQKNSQNVLALSQSMEPVDLVLVEGRQPCPLGKLEVHRLETSRELFCEKDPDIVAVASDHPIAGTTLPRFDLNDVAAIADFVMARMARAQ